MGGFRPWLLKGQCYYELREFERALELLEQALRHTPDGQTRMLALILRGACERAISEAIEAKLVELLTAGDVTGAARLAERTLRTQPDNVVVRYYQCVILLMLDRWAEAKTAIAAAVALDTVDGANAESFKRLLQQILLIEFRPQLERVRKYLRRAKPKAALKVLAACPPELRGDEQIEALRSFAYERVGHGARVFRGLRVNMGQRRMREANVPRLAPDLLEPLLCWLLHDELQDGVDAMNDSQFAGAEQSFIRAEQIDDRSSVVAYLHAVAILRALEEDFDSKRPPTLDDAEASLEYVAELADQAVADPLVRDQARQLIKVARGYRRELDKARAHLEKVRPVYECVKRFNTLMERYQHRSIASYGELANVRFELQRILEDVTRLRRQHTATSPEGEVLGQLATAIAKVQGPLP